MVKKKIVSLFSADKLKIINSQTALKAPFCHKTIQTV